MAMITVSYSLLLVLMMVMMITQGFQGSLRRSPIKFNIRSVENYDKMRSLNEEATHKLFKLVLKAKDEVIKAKDELIKAKDEVIKAKDEVIKAKDEVIKAKDEFIKSKDEFIKYKDEFIKYKDDVIKYKDETITQIEKKAYAITHSKYKSQDIRLKEKENQILGLKGLLSSRGIFENYLDFCLIELKITNIASPSQKFNASNIIDIMANSKHNLPKDSECIKILNAAEDCNADLKSVYATLCRDIHSAPWNGPSLNVYLNEMNQCEQCIVYFIADSMLLNY